MPKSSALPKPPIDAPELSYEASLQALEDLVQRMESGQMPLDEMLGAYTRGNALLASCRAKLAAVEQQIKRIDEKNHSIQMQNQMQTQMETQAP